MMFKSSLNMPGPGAYESYSATNKQGNYLYSKFKNSKASRFSPSSSKRFREYDRLSGAMVPGPGYYVPKTGISK